MPIMRVFKVDMPYRVTPNTFKGIMIYINEINEKKLKPELSFYEYLKNYNIKPNREIKRNFKLLKEKYFNGKSIDKPDLSYLMSYILIENKSLTIKLYEVEYDIFDFFKKNKTISKNFVMSISYAE